MPINCSNIEIESLDKVRPMNNNVVIKNITDSIEDSYRNSKLNANLEILRSESNKKREKSMGTVVAVSNCLFVGNAENRLYIDEEILGKNIIYDTHSRLANLVVKSDSDSKYYLVRFPDIIALVEDKETKEEDL